MKPQKLELTWIGKGEEPRLEPRILMEDPKYSYGDPTTENMLIYGDNLLALKALEQDFAGKIKCIYIDPPFNTGQAFDLYDDNLEHSIWLNLMFHRLNILHRLLNNKGVLWIHLDDTEVHYCKMVLDEIFGRRNFLAQINYERSGSAGIGQGGLFVDTAEYILIYKKELFEPNFSINAVPLEKKVMQRYNKILVDEGRKVLIDEFKSKSNGEPVKIFKHNNFVIETISLASYNKRESTIRAEFHKHFEKVFRTTNPQQENSFQQELISKMGEGLYSVEYIPSRGKDKGEQIIRYYQNQEIFAWLKDSAEKGENDIVKTNKLTNIWAHADIPKADLANEGGVEFKRGKKPENLLKRIIEISTREGEIVLDSFLGSGTTAAVAHKMKRKWIGIELGEHALTHCFPRLSRIVEDKDKVGVSKIVNWQGGGGFKFYTLATSLLRQDKYGNWIISKDYNANMLAAAMAKQEGFKYEPDPLIYWKQGKSSEKDYIFTTTQFITVEMLDKLYDEMQLDESLLIAAKSFQEECEGRHGNITIKKIPQMLLGRCEFNRDDYSFNIVNMPYEIKNEVSKDNQVYEPEQENRQTKLF